MGQRSGPCDAACRGKSGFQVALVESSEHPFADQYHRDTLPAKLRELAVTLIRIGNITIDECDIAFP